MPNSVQVFYICNVNTKPVLVSKNSRADYAFLLLIPATLPALYAISIFVDCIQKSYYNIFDLLVAVIAIAIASYSYWLVFNISNLEIDDEKLAIKSWLGYTSRAIYLKDVTGWIELQFVQKGKEYYKLTIYTNTGKYTLSSLRYDNYRAIKSALTNGVPFDAARYRLAMRLDNFVEVMGFIGVGVICFVLLVNVLVTDKPDSLVSIKSVIKQEPKIVTAGTRSMHQTLRFYLSEYPDIEFIMSYDGFINMDLAAFSDGSKIDLPLQLQISANDYEVKLAHIRKPGFWENQNYDNVVYVFGYSDDRYVYLKPDDYGKKNKDRYKSVVLFALAGLFFIGMGIKRLFNGAVNLTAKQLQ